LNTNGQLSESFNIGSYYEGNNLNVGINVSSVTKKKVAAATTSVSSTKAFSTAGLALQLEVPTAVASIPDPKVGEEC
jgi:hypothetical protein